MNLNHEELHRLLAALADSDIQEFHLEGEDFRLEIKRSLPSASGVVAVPSEEIVASSNPPSSPTVLLDNTVSNLPSNPPPVGPGSRTDFVEITAPMVGTFYRAPAPGDPAFVEVGSRITSGQTVCILEAMKLMNELEAEISGEVLEILVENGTPVEFGQALMRVKQS